MALIENNIEKVKIPITWVIAIVFQTIILVVWLLTLKADIATLQNQLNGHDMNLIEYKMGQLELKVNEVNSKADKILDKIHAN